MDTKIARNLVEDTFGNGFDKNRFYFFIKNLLNEIEEEDKDKFIYRGNFIPDAYKPYIKTLERIGKYQDSKQNKIDLLIVQLKKETSLEHARTMQRNFIAWYLNGSRGDVLKDAALVAFVSPNQADWRFSLVRMDYKIGEASKIKQELTPARRFSFLVGENEASHTAQSKLAPLIEDDKNNPTLDQLEEVFNIEKVTKEFFEKYRELFLWVKDELEKLLKKDKKIKKDFESKKVNTVDFAKKLLGQIVFLYFLQKKGWFGVQRNDDWGTGPKDFLRRLFEKQIVDYKNFFNEILEPLFYEALARERDDNFYSRFNCKIPFLNGGLFDPLNDYDWVHTDINLPNELFSNSLKTKEGDTGTGILDIFDRFNFTVKEDEPLDKEVAVDPEMLGKVFENLLEVKDRKSKGTYYTPREIVHYMCQQSLINYLATELNSSWDGNQTKNTSEVPKGRGGAAEGGRLLRGERISKKDIETLIQLGETAIEHDSHISENGKETPTYSYKLPESVRKNAKLIDEKLADIKVCDPAIGSGAFPVGMMNIIVKTRSVLNSYLKNDTGRSTYDFKRQAIANSLYGVDIDLGAVEIAKLRLWLSLIVDEQDIKKIKPLPNLDYKIMQGNSLIELLSPDLVRKGSDQEKNKLIDQLSDLKNQYFEATSRKVKIKLRDQINELIVFIANYDKAKELEQSKNLLANLKAQKSLFSLGPENLTLGEFESKEVKKLKKKVEELEKIKDTSPEDHFEWHLNFNEVFEEDGGFDVVIANPPYVRVQHLSYKEIDEYKKRYLTAYKRIDVSTLFLELACQLMNGNGIASYITSSQFLKTEYGRKVREFLTDKLKRIIFFGDSQVFSDVINYTSIFLFAKSNTNKYFKLTNAEAYLGRRSFNSYIDKHSKKILKISLGSESWNIEHPDTFIILNKIRSLCSISLKEVADVDYGLVTGKDKVFVFKKGENRSLEKSPYVYPLLKPSNISRYHLNKPNHFVIYPYKADNDKTVIVDEKELKNNSSKLYSYLLNNKNKLLLRKDSRKKIEDDSKEWYSLMRHSSFQKAFREKIVTQALCKRNEFCLDTKGFFFTGGSIYSVCSKNRKISNKALLGLLNSKVCEFFYQLTCPIRQHGYKFYAGNFLKQFPISQKFLTENKRLKILVTNIIDEIGEENGVHLELNKLKRIESYEKQIDQMVYKLYNLTPKEVEIVEGKK